MTTGQFDTDQTPADETKDPQWYRDALAREKERIAERDQEITVLKAQQMQMVVEKLGLDITEGPGRAVADFYDGPADEEKVAEFASQYGWRRPDPAEPIVTEVREAQERVANVTATGGPPEPPSTDDEIRKAELAGDWQTAMHLKLEQHMAQQQQRSP